MIDIMSMLSERTPLRIGYWLYLPAYVIFFILFQEKGPDPLGRYGYLTEQGKSNYGEP
jgi:hypothetical protein